MGRVVVGGSRFYWLGNFAFGFWQFVPLVCDFALVKNFGTPDRKSTRLNSSH